jgi:hypothetical protein
LDSPIQGVFLSDITSFIDLGLLIIRQDGNPVQWNNMDRFSALRVGESVLDNSIA